MIIQGPEAPPGGFVRNAAAIKQAVGDTRAGQRRPAPQRSRLRRRGAASREPRLRHAVPRLPRRSALRPQGRGGARRGDRAVHRLPPLHEPPGGQPAGALRREPELGPRAASADRARRHAAPRDGRRRRPRRDAGCATARAPGQSGDAARAAAGPRWPDALLVESRRRLRIPGDVPGRRSSTACVSTSGSAARSSVETVAREAPDAIVVAPGRGLGLAFAPIDGGPRLFDLFTALDRADDEWDGRVVIVGGDSESCFLSLYLAGRGRRGARRRAEARVLVG